jgi:hypothetical protein
MLDSEIPAGDVLIDGSARATINTNVCEINTDVSVSSPNVNDFSIGKRRPVKTVAQDGIAVID